ncbi:hypothetical protein BDF19DRAFT_387922, partial [Syncephalis fuscata]
MRQPCRTIYLGGLPSNADARDILEQIRAHGVIESIRMLPERGCAFVSFLSAAAASAFHNDYAGSNANGNHGANNSANGNGNNGSGPALTRRSLVVSGQEIKVSWGKPSPVPLHVLRAAEEDGATRTVFISSLVLEDTEPRVRDACEQFGEVETLRWFPDRRIAFAHFTSIADAIRCVAWFRSATDQWFGRHVGYGRDRCVLVNGTLQPDGPSTGLSQLDRMDLGRGSPTAMMMLDQPMVPPSPDHRTVYLGNLKRSTTVEDLCNVIRGGALERIRLIPEKRIAFVSFITADSAADFYRRALHPGLVVKHQRLRPGWGRPRPLPSEVMRAVSVGASRNVYLGGLDDARVFTVERLRDDFAEYGEIELVNTLPERQCAFVNFTSVAAAVKAVDAIRGKPGYERVRVNFGKDRCANPPR